MTGIGIATRAVLCGVFALGIPLVTACSNHDRPNETAGNLGRLSIPLVTSVGGTTYRLDAGFLITGEQTYLKLTTSAGDAVLSTTLTAGSYTAFLQYFTLFTQDGTGALHPVSATPVSTAESFTVFADSTTTVNFQFDTDGGVVTVGSGTVNVTFGVTETGAPCTALGPGCPDGSWCAPTALTGAPTGCVPAGTTPLGAACASPLDCVAEATCHDFGAGPVCTSLCTPAEFTNPCASGGTCLEVDPSFGLCTPTSACNPISVDPAARTVQSRRFFLDFSNLVSINPEDVDALRWAEGPNLAQSFASDACTSGAVEFFGNSWAPPDPPLGGKVLVGSGSTGTWEQDGASILIRSTSTGCDPSAAVPVETRYTFRDGKAADTIEVERQFDLASAPMNRSFRPHIPRMTNQFDRVLHPDATNSTLVSENIFDCPNGCTRSNWDGSWFAYYASSGALAGQGVIVLRKPSAILAELWIDNDAGITETNASSALLVPPAGGFARPITERELLCFFDAATWTPDQQAALTLPEGCTFGLACDGSGTGEPLPCHPNPCQHGGTCSSDGTGGYTCQCPPTITGHDCELAFTDVQLGQLFTCGLRSDGQILCWGTGYGATGVPSGTFRALSAGVLAACALSSDGVIQCWGFSNQGVLSPPPGTFDTLSINSDHACALSNHVPTCWGGITFGSGGTPDGLFSDIEVGILNTCGVRLDGTLACLGLNDKGQSSPPPGTFRAVSSSGVVSCGLHQSDSTVECWGDVGIAFGGAALPTGPLQMLDVDYNGVCALDPYGHIVCWGFGAPAPPPGTFKQVTLHDYRGCAISTDDRLVCWGSNGPESVPPY